jgi:mono/diheme cytochrome c family protein
VLNRGQERFDIFCSECHGRLGDGNGMIPARGYRRPPSFHTETLRTAAAGHFFDVITNGFGAMPPYRTLVPVRDRWAIVAYMRALQISHSATMADVPADVRARLGGAQ